MKMRKYENQNIKGIIYIFNILNMVYLDSNSFIEQ